MQVGAILRLPPHIRALPSPAQILFHSFFLRSKTNFVRGLILMKMMTTERLRRRMMDNSSMRKNTSSNLPMDMSRREKSQSEKHLQQVFTVIKIISLCRGRCLGMIVEGGYMFKMDPDLSNFPCVTWHCPKYKVDGCPASFVTRYLLVNFFSLNFCKWGIFVEVELLSKSSFEVVQPA